MEDAQKVREKRLSILQKLFEKAEGCRAIGFFEEADGAMLQASRKMLQWNIEEHEVARRSSNAVKIVHDRVQCKYDYYGPWEGQLAGDISKYFFVETNWNIRKPGGKDYRGQRLLPVPGFVHFYGTEENVMAAKHAFDFYRNVINDVAWKKWAAVKKQGIEDYDANVLRPIRKDRPGYSYKAKEQDAVRLGLIPNVRKFVLSFYKGAADGIRIKLYHEFKANTQVGVVPSYSDDIKKFKEENKVRERIVEDIFVPDMSAFTEGLTVGQKLSLNKAIKA